MVAREIISHYFSGLNGSYRQNWKSIKGR